ncbi:MAG: alpha/beta fold hydrolase [Candidatus Dormibacteria bacterium]
MTRRAVHLSVAALAGAANAVAAFLLYADNGGAAHFVLHSLVGTTAGFGLLLLWRGLGHPPRRGQLWLPYGLSAYAMLPDVIYKLGPFHRDWMDVFMGHVSADELRAVVIPVLLPVLAGLIVAYAWVTARQRSHLATLQPAWVQRPWGRLCVRTAGSGPPILLLHGLGGSGRYWESLARQFTRTHTIIAPDLGGFGKSDKPHVTYDLDFHLANIDAAVAHASPGSPITVIGHSFGGVLAATWASRHTERVQRLALVAAPYPDGSTTMEDRLLHDRVTRAMARGTTVSYAVHVVMGVMAAVVVPLLHSSSVPREVMSDYMRHTIRSYVGSLHSVLLGPDITPLLHPLEIPMLLVYGSEDREATLESADRYQQALGGGNLLVINGGHQLLLATGFSPLSSWLEVPAEGPPAVATRAPSAM